MSRQLAADGGPSTEPLGADTSPDLHVPAASNTGHPLYANTRSTGRIGDKYGDTSRVSAGLGIDSVKSTDSSTAVGSEA